MSENNLIVLIYINSFILQYAKIKVGYKKKPPRIYSKKPFLKRNQDN